MQYNDPEQNPVPQQKAGSNFPGEGVRLCSPPLRFLLSCLDAHAALALPCADSVLSARSKVVRNAELNDQGAGVTCTFLVIPAHVLQC